MFIVYILYSSSGDKTYTGFTSDIDRRLHEHNISEQTGFTLRYRPWTLIHSEAYETKQEAITREKFLKTGKGRELVKQIAANFLKNQTG